VLRARGGDEDWAELVLPRSMSHVRSLQNWRCYMPRGALLVPDALDMWICLASGERITQHALAYVVDSFPHNLHTFLVALELRELMEPPRDKADFSRLLGETQGGEQRAGLWFPTLFLTMEVKTTLPEDGVDWLAVRVTSKAIQDGRFDLDVTVRDVEGELTALSHQVAMVCDYP
jgi:hypothetical protein